MIRKQGFTLIEIIIALLIGSLIIGSLYKILQQIQRGVTMITTVIDLDAPLISLHNQLERDLLGTFVPISTAQIKAESQETKKTNTQTGQTNNTENKKEPEKAIKDVFVGTQKNNGLFMHFITNGGIQTVSPTDQKEVPMPALKRVIYALEPDPTRAGLFILWYGQTYNLDPEAINNPKNIQRYELAWGLKNLTATFKIYEVPQEQAKNIKEKDAPKVPEKLVTLTSFIPADVLKQYKTVLPAYVEIKGEVVDERQARSEVFIYQFALPGYKMPKPSKDKQAAKAPEKIPEKNNEKKDTNIVSTDTSQKPSGSLALNTASGSSQGKLT